MEIVQNGNEDFLFRRVPVYPPYTKPDGSISSLAFTLTKGEDGISTDLERLADKDKLVQGKTKFRLAKINAGYIRKMKLTMD